MSPALAHCKVVQCHATETLGKWGSEWRDEQQRNKLFSKYVQKCQQVYAHMPMINHSTSDSCWQDVIAPSTGENFKLRCTNVNSCYIWEPTCSPTWTKANQLESSHNLPFHMQKPSYISWHIIYIYHLPLQIEYFWRWPDTHRPLLFHWATSVPLQAGSPTVLCGLSLSWISDTTCIFVPLDGRSSKSHMDLAFEKRTHWHIWSMEIS